jgi:hypothetical protein
MHCEPFALSDIDSLDELQPPGWGDLKPVFSYYLASKCCTPVKVTAGTAMIGIGCAISFGGTAWLAHIIVHGSHRRRGAGRAIVDHLVKQLEQAGCKTISLVATNEGRPLYAKAGFIEQMEYAVLRRPEETPSNAVRPRIQSGGSSPLELVGYGPADRGSILALDHAISGERRESILDEHLSSCRLAKLRGTITGYYLPGLGEGPVYAIDPDAGEMLLQFRLQAGSAMGRCGMPATNGAAVKVCQVYGLTEMRRATRMVLGQAFAWRPECIYARIGGNLG